MTREQSPDSLKVASTAPDDAKLTFVIEIFRDRQREEYNCTLKGQIEKRDMQAIVRYDIHDGEHENPAWFKPETVLPREPHLHIYNPRAIREGLKWCACASPIRGLKRKAFENLVGQFLIDLNIGFDEHEAHQELFGWMKQ